MKLNETLGLGGKLRQLCSDSGGFDFSDFRGNIDLFFIDGAHSNDYVKIGYRARIWNAATLAA